MSANSFVASLILYIIVPTLAQGQTNDPLARKLDEAKEAYRKSMQEAKKPILKWLDDAEAKARDASDIDRVTEVQNDRKAFQNEGVIPKRLSIADRSKSAEKVRRAALTSFRGGGEVAKRSLLDAYRASLKNYMAAKNDVAARKIKAEMDQLQQDQSAFDKLAQTQKRPQARPISHAPPRLDLGSWTVENKELSPSASGTNSIFFGDKTWTDYDFIFKARVSDAKANGFIILVHADLLWQHEDFCIGVDQNTRFKFNTRFNREKTAAGYTIQRTFPSDQWCDIKVEVRGTSIRCLIDGEEVLRARDERYTEGTLGFLTFDSVVRFKDLTVTQPDGTILWEFATIPTK